MGKDAKQEQLEKPGGLEEELCRLRRFLRAKKGHFYPLSSKRKI
jgi:hypothetical protein